MSNINLFGPIPEKNVTFIVDTSGSMYFSLPSLQENLIETLLELRDKGNCSFNIIEFNRKVSVWADQCVPCNSETVTAATRWIRTREASPGNNVAEAILLAFEDSRCDSIYIVSNSLPVERKDDIIGNSLFVSEGRPINCIFVSSTLSDPAAEEFMHDLAWEAGGSFKIVEVSEDGRCQRASLVFDGERRRIRSNQGQINLRHQYCSVAENPVDFPPTGMIPDGLSLPWESRYNPLWWSNEPIAYPEPLPMTRNHFARPILRQREIRDSVIGAAAFPGAGVLLVDKKVLARRIEDGNYYLGRVKSEVGRDKFLVQFDELNRGKYRDTEFEKVWIYDIISFVDAFRHAIIPGDKVLVSEENGKYAPAVVLQGNEQRSDPNFHGCDRHLVVNHLNGRTETLELGTAIWIPEKLYDRVTFELRLPASSRRTLDRQIGHPGQEVGVANETFHDVCYDNDVNQDVVYEEILMDENPEKKPVTLNDYYESLYPEWPWWWKMWYNRYPAHSMRCGPRVVSRSKIVKSRSPQRVKFPPRENVYYYSDDDMNYVDYDDATPQRQPHYRRLDIDEEMEYRRQASPNRRIRSAYQDNVETQRIDKDFRRVRFQTDRSGDRSPWRYWRGDEPPSQMGESVYASNVRASSSPSRRQLDLNERMQRAEQRHDEQRWFESRMKQNSGDGIPMDIEYIDLERNQRRRDDSPFQEDRPRQSKQFVDYVAQDREMADRNRKFEPPPSHHHHRNSHRHQKSSYPHKGRKHVQRDYGDGYYRETTYYEDYAPPANPYLRDESPRPAGVPVLNTRESRPPDGRSRRDHSNDQLAAEEGRGLRNTQNDDEKRHYQAIAHAWYAEKEARKSEQQQKNYQRSSQDTGHGERQAEGPKGEQQTYSQQSQKQSPVEADPGNKKE